MCNESGTNIGDLLGIGDVIKSFDSIIETILEPRGLDLVILEGHKKIIDKAINGEQVSEELAYQRCIH